MKVGFSVSIVWCSCVLQIVEIAIRSITLSLTTAVEYFYITRFNLTFITNIFYEYLIHVTLLSLFW